ncbi:cysteine-rich protein 2-binding protein [Nephila pilipes]|uniref:Cysteine-rich protein 2-binding protein n=1 Tax=Nephila pilipes TaxID=299642 RepID=A0A8X6QRL1_NEPPI|nr:cysteine-rich protein 2-binding protein [Nephila pilipes]
MDIKPILHCYCLTVELEHDMLICTECEKRYHPACLKSGRPSPLAGDIYFNFTCQNCSLTGAEVIKRKKLQWTLVIMIALYNLQLQGAGKCGYFRWREHICRFIEKNWAALFGEERKKSATWHGTVAGALSTGANRFFVSGVEVLGENGWWSLKSSKLPSLDELDSVALTMKASRKRQAPSEAEVSSVVEGSRKKNQNVVEAAVALKEKKASIACDSRSPSRSPKSKKKLLESKVIGTDSSNLSFEHKLKLVVSHPDISNSTNFVDENSKKSIPKIIIKKEKDCLSTDETSDINKEMPVPKAPEQITNQSNDFSHMDVPLGCDVDHVAVIREALEKMSAIENFEECCAFDEENSNCSKTVGTTKKFHPDTGRKRRVVTKEESLVKEVVIPETKYRLMYPYEEEQLLQKLQNNYTTAMKERPEVRRLYRKLVVRKLQRQHGIPNFNIDAKMHSLLGMDPPDYLEPDKSIMSAPVSNAQIVLDRFHSNNFNARGKSQQYTSFITRLMGVEDGETSFLSPYTERSLKPFIYRDYNMKPLKMRLLEEILLYTNRNNPNWIPPKQSPIDYCYVRPQYIPGINNLCHKFFWPGIDMSECLQYPDFSCVALYKKVIIGFAFIVPDAKFNEAYISFMFCHPEWRRSGIGRYMLYHLIQTCIGKDITLHVSASSPAVALYQGMGFQIEELIHEFYDKYLPYDSRECRHALFLRLSSRTVILIEDNQKENNVTIAPLPSKEIINLNEESDDEHGKASKIQSIILHGRSSRSNKGKPPDRLGYLAHENKKDPENYKEVLSRNDKNKWLEAIEEEMKSLYNNHTWDLVKFPKGKKPIACK